MKRIILGLILLTLFAIDWLIFHDFFKSGERYSVVQFLTGLVSLPLFYILGKDFFQDKL